MKKESKEMLKTIISNQELIMTALKIDKAPVKIEKAVAVKPADKKLPAKKVTKKTVKKTSGKK